MTISKNIIQYIKLSGVFGFVYFAYGYWQYCLIIVYYRIDNSSAYYRVSFLVTLLLDAFVDCSQLPDNFSFPQVFWCLAVAKCLFYQLFTHIQSSFSQDVFIISYRTRRKEFHFFIFSPILYIPLLTFNVNVLQYKHLIAKSGVGWDN